MRPAFAGRISYFRRSNLDLNSLGVVAVDFLAANSGISADLEEVGLAALETALGEGNGSGLGNSSCLGELTFRGGSHVNFVSVGAGGLAPCDLRSAALCLLSAYLSGSRSRSLNGYNGAVRGNRLLAVGVNIACYLVVVGLALGKTLVGVGVGCSAADLLEGAVFGGGTVDVVACNVRDSIPCQLC